jgi:hypothetical protein
VGGGVGRFADQVSVSSTIDTTVDVKTILEGIVLPFKSKGGVVSCFFNNAGSGRRIRKRAWSERNFPVI